MHHSGNWKILQSFVLPLRCARHSAPKLCLLPSVLTGEHCIRQQSKERKSDVNVTENVIYCSREEFLCDTKSKRKPCTVGSWTCVLTSRKCFLGSFYLLWFCFIWLCLVFCLFCFGLLLFCFVFLLCFYLFCLGHGAVVAVKILLTVVLTSGSLFCGLRTCADKIWDGSSPLALCYFTCSSAVTSAELLQVCEKPFNLC